jgi:uridylate kinase
MLKVSGEAMAGENGFGINPEVVQAIAREAGAYTRPLLSSTSACLTQ